MKTGPRVTMMETWNVNRQTLFARFKKECEERDLLTDFEAICQIRRVRLEDVFSPSRLRQLSQARAECWFLMRRKGINGANASFPDIARLWGRDHTTIMSAVKVHMGRATEPIFPPEEADTKEWRFPPEIRALRRRVSDLEELMRRLEGKLDALRKALV